MHYSTLARAGALLFLVASPLAAEALFNTVEYSPAFQCAPFAINFEGGAPPQATPLTLTVVPLSSSPFTNSLTDWAWNTSTKTGHALALLPLREGAQFIASLEDANGVPVGQVSNVTTVEAFDSTDCLHDTHVTTTATQPFTVQDDLVQCEAFSVTFNISEVVSAPAIRAFIPGNISFEVNQTSADDSTGTATYIMNVSHGLNVALSITDNDGHSQTTQLLTVGGNSSTNGTCISSTESMWSSSIISTASSVSSSSSSTSTASSRDTTDSSNSLSEGTIIAIAAVSGSVVALIILAAGIWLIRARRKLQVEASDTEAGVPDCSTSGDDKRPPLSSRFSQDTGFNVQATFAPPSNSSVPPGKGKEKEKATGTCVRNPLYTNSQICFSTPHASPEPPEKRATRSSVTGVVMEALSSNARASIISRSLPPTPPLSLSDVSAASRRRTPPLATMASILRSVRGTAERVLSPTPTTSTVENLEVDMAEILAPLNNYRVVLSPSPDSVARASTIGPDDIFNCEPSQSSSPINPPSPGPESALTLTPTRNTSAHTYERPPELLSPVSMYSARTTLRTPVSNVYRQPPHAMVPQSPIPSPLPSPL